MLVEKNLLKWLFDVAHGKAIVLRAGIISDTEGKPLISLHRNICLGSYSPTKTDVERDIEYFLDLLVSNPELCEARVNALVRGEVVSPLPTSQTRRSGPRRAPGAFVPVVLDSQDVPIAVLAVAFTTATPQGDCLADRVFQCEVCGHYSISRTKVRRKFCSRKCLWAAARKKRGAAKRPADS